MPLHTFPLQDEFAWRHEHGTLVEMQNEEKNLKLLNQNARPVRAWPISPVPGMVNPFSRTWLFLVETPSQAESGGFPSVTDRFTIDMASTVQKDNCTYSLVHLQASRIPNPWETATDIADNRIKAFAAFKVDFPHSRRNQEGEEVEIDLVGQFRVASSIEDLEKASFPIERHQLITIQWDVSSVTFEAELAALRYFTETKRLKERQPSTKSRMAFEMIQSFHTSHKKYYNLHGVFPHMSNPKLERHQIPPKLVERFRAFTRDQIAAYYGLTRVPNGVYFVNGCPGSGKTEWNMVLSALMQSRQKARAKRRGRVLFLVDINKTVDDAAQRYLNLSREVGLSLCIIRMHGWPLEMKESAKLQGCNGREQSVVKSAEPDFTSRFLTTVGLSRSMTSARNSKIVPTLDEASWEYFETHKEDSFPGLKVILAKMEDGNLLTTSD